MFFFFFLYFDVLHVECILRRSSMGMAQTFCYLTLHYFCVLMHMVRME